MEKFYQLEFPLRGSIGIGDYSYNSNIFLSNIFKALNMCEISQEWSGCTILPKDEDEIFKLISGTSKKGNNEKSSYLHSYNIPLKDNKIFKGLCLNWSYNINNSELFTKLEYLKGNIEKYKNTKDYLEYVSSLDDFIQNIQQSDGTVITMKSRKTISGMTLIFEDKNGNPIEPIDPVNITVFGGKNNL